ncbi:iron-siderophore ABC transporter substrate-binding protein [Schnuerera sp. xch1]|uniref:ABC transporter substrate-binding protein n=1 Tax=Schnuerera sp. xch1 TaxID=2874283 RepID=UPI001CC140E8|nr:iron-siderophore ABC transporter substrate-binding protein [Schnuerera sp. xch1]MBZ2174650.1 iron-siderophore ABC transporter substrate-binding protein [Schnuerera sp. xch1]
MKKFISIFALLLIILSLVACSPNAVENSNQTEDTSNSIAIEHSAGTTVLDKPAERVVVLEWIYGEEMLALGAQPVGMTDIPGYNSWMNSGSVKLDENVENLGTRGNANLEDIAALKPDLIVTADYYEYDYNLLSQIAPTIVLTPYPGEEYPTGEYDHMISSIEIMGKALGLEEKATEVINDLESAYEKANKKLEETSIDFDYIELIDFSTDDTVSMYLYTDTSIHTTILEKIGFNNIYKPKKFELYGQTNINVENLVGLDDHTLFVVADKGEDVFSKGLISEDVLNGLEFYINDRIHYLGSNASPFGPLSTLNFIDTVVEVVTENE